MGLLEGCRPRNVVRIVNLKGIKKGDIILKEPNIVAILEDLAKVWNNLMPDTQKFLSILLVGKRKGNDIIFNETIKHIINNN